MTVDLSKTIVAKSDQMNSDDLIAGPITIRIRDVTVSGKGKDDQPVNIYYDGDDNKPYKPCKSMRRVLVGLWGTDGKSYIGRHMTLFRDPNVSWGGEKVGGIRISHMSDIDGDKNLALTVTRGSKKAYLVRPLRPTQPQQAPSDNPMQVMAKRIRAAIRAEDTIAGIDAILSTDFHADLEAIKATSQTAYDTLIGEAQQRRAELSAGLEGDEINV